MLMGKRRNRLGRGEKEFIEVSRQLSFEEREEKIRGIGQRHRSLSQQKKGGTLGRGLHDLGVCSGREAVKRNLSKLRKRGKRKREKKGQ